jgi:VanZ family protein
MVDIGRLHINDKVMHFCAYLILSLLPVIGFRDRGKGIVIGLSMFLLGILMEGRSISPPAVPSNSAMSSPTAPA